MRLKFNHAAFEEVLRSPKVQAWVNATTQEIAGRAGPGYVGSTRHGKTRFRGIVYADTWRARHDNQNNNTLVRVLR